MSSLLNSKNEGNFVQDTSVGYDQTEIEKLNFEQLIMLKKTVYGYLKNINLKKRNFNFKRVFFRIKKEIEKRVNDDPALESKRRLLGDKSSVKKKPSFPKFDNIVFPDFLNDTNFIKKSKNNLNNSDYIIKNFNVSFDFMANQTMFSTGRPFTNSTDFTYYDTSDALQKEMEIRSLMYSDCLMFPKMDEQL